MTQAATSHQAHDAAAGLTVEVRNPAGESVGTVDLPAEVFATEVNIPLMHQVVVAQQAAARQGTHDTKTRGEVAGGSRKPYRQKGTGRARQGSVRAPQFAGGGTVHGPVPRAYDHRTPKKMKVAALRSALSDRAGDRQIAVLTGVVETDTPSTKNARRAIANTGNDGKKLVVLSRQDSTGWKSLRNLPDVHVIAPDQLNTYDVLVHDEVVFTQHALELFLGNGRTADNGEKEGEQ